MAIFFTKCFALSCGELQPLFVASIYVDTLTTRIAKTVLPGKGELAI